VLQQFYLYHTALCYYVDTISFLRLWKMPMGKEKKTPFDTNKEARWRWRNGHPCVCFDIFRARMTMVLVVTSWSLHPSLYHHHITCLCDAKQAESIRNLVRDSRNDFPLASITSSSKDYTL
jgi:hypothetical protein